MDTVTLDRLLVEFHRARDEGRPVDHAALLGLLEHYRDLGERMVAFASLHIPLVRGLIAEQHAP